MTIGGGRSKAGAPPVPSACAEMLRGGELAPWMKNRAELPKVPVDRMVRAAREGASK